MCKRGPEVKFVVRLSVDERAVLEKMIRTGRDAALSCKTRPRPDARIFDGEKEAKLIALACLEPPEGHARWSLRLLEKRVVELGIVEATSDSTIGRLLKKTRSNLTKAGTG